MIYPTNAAGPHSFRLRGLALLLASLLVMTASSIGQAQDADSDKTPQPEDITLQTKDGVAIKCTWYAGTQGKNTVPIVIVHGWEGNRGQFDALALYLQSKEGGGHAVIVPDLRGHGDSNLKAIDRNGKQEPYKLELMRSIELGQMVQFDMEAVKAFLMEQNNQGKVNIELLTLIGSEFGSLVAVNFAAQDWSWRQLVTMKQGQDVKALVLISPLQSFKGFTANNALKHPVVRSKLSMLIVVGSQDRSRKNDATRIYAQLENFHPTPPKEEIREKKDLFLGELDTSLNGHQLITAPGLNVAGMIKTFIDLRLVAKRDELKWTDRTSPFASN